MQHCSRTRSWCEEFIWQLWKKSVKCFGRRYNNKQYLTIWPFDPAQPPGVGSKWHLVLAPLHCVRSSYDEYERNRSSTLGGDTITSNIWFFDLLTLPRPDPGVGSKWNVGLAPCHGVRSSYTKFERNRSSSLGGDRILSLKMDRRMYLPELHYGVTYCPKV